MVIRINTSKSISKALNYNEQKVVQKKAECILASGFIKDLETLFFNDKLQQFQRLNSLNDRVSVNTLHVSLNFSPSEKISLETLKEIAKSYRGKNRI